MLVGTPLLIRKSINLVYMMSKLYKTLVYTVCVVMFIGCSKDNNNNVPNYPEDKGDLVYTIEDVADTSLEQVGMIRKNIFIKRISGSRQEEVRLSAVGLPEGVTVTFDPQTSSASFYSLMTITATRAAAGKYAIQVAGKTLKSDSVKVPMTLNILPYSNAAVAFNAVFIETRNCDGNGGASTHEVSLSPDPSVKDRVLIKGFWSGTWTNIVYANLNTANKTLDIPVQIASSITISGSGSYTDDQIVIAYKVVGDGFTENCTATLDRVK